jgi:hypothetical protein
MLAPRERLGAASSAHLKVGVSILEGVLHDGVIEAKEEPLEADGRHRHARELHADL